MRSLLIKLRGLVGVGLTWAIVWGLAFAAIAAIVGVIDPDSVDIGEGPLDVAPYGALFGFVAGSLFALLLIMGDGRRKIRELSLARTALWGAIGTALMALWFSGDASMLLVLSPMGGALAAGMVAIAKRADSKAQSSAPAETV
jgi:hypothetical protein